VNHTGCTNHCLMAYSNAEQVQVAGRTKAEDTGTRL